MPAVKRRGLSFGKSVGAGADDKQTHTLKRAGSVESVTVRIYPGPETDLEIQIYTVSPEGDRKRPVVENIGKDHIDGDDDHYQWSPSHEFEQDAEIWIEYTNNDGSNSYDYRVNMDIEYRDPLDRIAAALRGAF